MFTDSEITKQEAFIQCTEQPISKLVFIDDLLILAYFLTYFNSVHPPFLKKVKNQN